MIRKGLTPVPKSLADLKNIVLCAQIGTTGAAYIKDRVQPTKKALYPQTTMIMYQQLKSKRCDAALYDAPILGAQRFLEPKAYGPIVGSDHHERAVRRGVPEGRPAPPRRQQGDQEAARQRHDRQAHQEVADVRRLEAARLQVRRTSLADLVRGPQHPALRPGSAGRSMLAHP